MAGFVQEVRSIEDCITHVVKSLSLPWQFGGNETLLQDAVTTRALAPILSPVAHPPFTRSLRDGYALRHADTVGASPSSPVFLRVKGDVAMGEAPRAAVGPEELAGISTGGVLPEGADAVVMLEDTALAGEWVEVRHAVQRGENLLYAGEDVAKGEVLVERGDLIDIASCGLLATAGIESVKTLALRIGILSTGDEIRPVSERFLPPGCIRDANASILNAALRRYGFSARAYGIVPDDENLLASMVGRVLEESDVLIVSGGSSVGVRDHCSRIFEALPPPGLLVRGINMVPGKPTLIGASAGDRKLVFGLPGHPLSCLVALIFVALPILLRVIEAPAPHVGRFLKLPLAEDLRGRAGSDEFTPMRIHDGMVVPIAAKSGYVSAMRSADGFIKLAANRETLRRGEVVDVWIW